MAGGHWSRSPTVQSESRAVVAKRRLVKLCVARYPIGDLVAMLRPSTVLFTSVDAYDASSDGVAAAGGVPVAFHQWYGNLTRPLALEPGSCAVRTPMRDWLPVL